MICRMLRELIAAQEGKAFEYTPLLTDAGGGLFQGDLPASYNDYNQLGGQGNRLRTPLTQREAKQHLQLYGGLEPVDWIMNGVNYVANAGASASWHFEDDTGTEFLAKQDPQAPGKPSLAPLMLTKLFQEPNPYMGWTDLFELTLIDWLILGNAYWVKFAMNGDKQPLALYRMAPEYVRIEPGPFGPLKYLYRLPGMQNEIEYTPDQIVHFKRPNPHSVYYGLGLVKGGARALDMELGLTNTMASYYERRAMPSGVVSTARRVPRDVFNKLKAQMRSFYSGSRNAGELMVLEAGLSYTSVSPDAVTAGFQDMGSWSRDRVLAMFNLNKALLGIWETGDNPNLPMWQLQFDQKTMLPICNRFSRDITRGLTRPGWDLDFCIDYEESQQPEEILNRASVVSKLPGVKVSEVRDAAGFPASTGDKEIDDTVLNMPMPNMDKNGQNGAPDPNLPSEAGRPPLPGNTRAIGVAGATDKGGRVAKTGGKAQMSPQAALIALDAIQAGLEGKAQADAHTHVGGLSGPHVDIPDALADKRKATIAIALASLNSQVSNAVAALERGLLDAVESKADGTVYQRVKKSAVWGTFTAKMDDIFDNAAMTALSSANVHHVGLGLSPAEEDYRALADELDLGAKWVSGLKASVLEGVLTAQRAGNDAIAPIRSALAFNGTLPGIEDAVLSAYRAGTERIAAANPDAKVFIP